MPQRLASSWVLRNFNGAERDLRRRHDVDTQSFFESERHRTVRGGYWRDPSVSEAGCRRQPATGSLPRAKGPGHHLPARGYGRPHGGPAAARSPSRKTASKPGDGRRPFRRGQCLNRSRRRLWASSGPDAPDRPISGRATGNRTWRRPAGSIERSGCWATRVLRGGLWR
jgi:hypothetical protein